MKQFSIFTDKLKIEISETERRNEFSAVILLIKESWLRKLGEISIKKSDRYTCYLRQFNGTYIPLHCISNPKKLHILRADEDFSIIDLVNCCKDIINTVDLVN